MKTKHTHGSAVAVTNSTLCSRGLEPNTFTTNVNLKRTLAAVRPILDVFRKEYALPILAYGRLGQDCFQIRFDDGYALRAYASNDDVSGFSADYGTGYIEACQNLKPDCMSLRTACAVMCLAAELNPRAPYNHVMGVDIFTVHLGKPLNMKLVYGHLDLLETW